jgi:hypothetical protein
VSFPAETPSNPGIVKLETFSCLFLQRCLLAKPEYDDLVEERAIAGVCGYPLCDNVLSEKSTR